LPVGLQIAAALRDTLEDTATTYHEPKEKFGAAVAEIVVVLTRRKNESYFEYIERVKLHEQAKAVKVCDSRSNLERAFADREHYGSLIPRYEKALLILAVNGTMKGL
jgi:(p)ppGpp synthase/HD superfamily hydrolase